MQYINHEVNGKVVRIPKQELEVFQQKLELSQEEAIDLWLSDHEIIVNQEQQQLNKIAQASGITRTIHQARATPPDKKRRVTVKEDKEKEEIVSGIVNFIQQTICGENVSVVNKSRTVTFELNGNHYKIDLIKQRIK